MRRHPLLVYYTNEAPSLLSYFNMVPSLTTMPIATIRLTQHRCQINPYTCAWISKQRAVEGSSDSGVEQLALPLVASIFSLVPGIALVASTIIRRDYVCPG